MITPNYPSSRPPMVTDSQIHHEPRRILQNLLHPHQKRHRLSAVDEAMVVAEREIHHRTNLDFAGDRHRSLFNLDRKSTRLNSSHANISYAVFCLQKQKDQTLHAFLSAEFRLVHVLATSG